MANNKKKTQAEKTASAAKAKNSKSGSNKETVKNQQTPESKIPVRLISSVVLLALAVLFTIVLFASEGALLKVLESIILGFIGRTGLVVSIPVFLYLFFIHAFSGKRPIKFRTVCLLIFIFLCGCLSHLNDVPDQLPKFFPLISGLYKDGVSGLTGGVFCGLAAVGIHWLCGPILSYLILILAAIVMLLGGMGITVSGLVKAYQERPRADWEDEDEEIPEEPSAAVVNHFANKRIEHLEQKRQREAERAALAQAEAERMALETASQPKTKAEDIMIQIGRDVEDPVAASGSKAEVDLEDEILPIIVKKDEEAIEPIVVEPLVMPPFAQREPIVIPKPATEMMVDASAAPKKESGKRSKRAHQEAEETAAQVAAEIEQGQAEKKSEYCYPPIDLLKLPGNGITDGTAEMRENTRRLNEALASFKIDAHIINVTRGPSVTRYEVELAKGVRLSKLTTAADDLALNLGATGVRIAPIPDRVSVVGIEVPNRAVNTVSLREVIDSNEFGGAKSKSSFAVGKDIGGKCIVGNIAKLPHMLIAGTTGSGKSVCMNSIIISLLYKASPDDVKLIMVDPKMVELGIYNGIPHLLIPVVTDPKKAAGSLQWAVTEMLRRYKAMSDAGVRDLESYNSIVENEEEGKRLPQVVVIIDELADLMLVAAKEVEESICRIAQMGRAAGIHLIIATQRPSADVITGLMKANIPSRIAFAVASAMESRIILDTQGAEKLVGKGDMLYAPIGCGKPKRVQGCFVSDPEVEAVASYVKTNFATDYDQDVMQEIERKAEQTGNSKPAAVSEPEPTGDEMYQDEMLPAAVDVILETKQASVSMLQRRLKLGYARAARIVDEMEEKGIVGPFQGSKPREILITQEQWETMRSGSVDQMEFDDLSMDDMEESEDF